MSDYDTLYLDPEALEEKVEDIIRKDSGCCEMSIPSSPDDDFYGFSYNNTGYFDNEQTNVHHTEM